MLLRNVLSPTDADAILNGIPRDAWVDGAITAGRDAAQVKENLTLSNREERTKNLSTLVSNRLKGNNAFQWCALPSAEVPPRFLMYETGMRYGRHLDVAFMDEVRTDLSYTIFLTDSYEGGELLIETQAGTQAVKGAVGDMYLYPTGQVHEVAKVTKGVRVVVIGWIQSKVPDTDARSYLFRLRLRIEKLRKEGKNEEILEAQSLYNFLLRRFSSN